MYFTVHLFKHNINLHWKQCIRVDVTLYLLLAIWNLSSCHRLAFSGWQRENEWAVWQGSYLKGYRALRDGRLFGRATITLLLTYRTISVRIQHVLHLCRNEILVHVACLTINEKNKKLSLGKSIREDITKWSRKCRHKIQRHFAGRALEGQEVTMKYADYILLKNVFQAFFFFVYRQASMLRNMLMSDIYVWLTLGVINCAEK